MNGPQDPRQTYPEDPGRPPYPQQPGAGAYDPGPGDIPPNWRKNVLGYGEDPRRKSPLLALMLSAMPGLGQVYVGYYAQGFINMFVTGGTIFLLSISGHQPSLHALDPFLGFFLAFYWLYNMVDAYRRAAFYNYALAGVGPVAFPENMKLPTGQGSLAGGVVLIAVGLLLFANTGMGVSLDWVEQWWPMGLVLVGAYLIYSNVTAKRPASPAPRAPQSGQPS